MPPKRLFVFCDGTGQDGLIVPDGPIKVPILGDSSNVLNDGVNQAIRATASEPRIEIPNGSSQKTFVTNVLRLSRAVKATDGMKEQIVFYQSGVGSQADFNGDASSVDVALQALGVVVASKIRDAYAFIAQNFVAGDEICLFGFSRGAYTVRKLAGLIDKIGLLETEKLGIFFNIWKELIDGKNPTIPPGTRTTRIRCICVWDTVGAVLNTIDALHIADNILPASVDVALHAVSLQENRQEFLPTLWKPNNKNQILKEVWFPGAHSDVGGGYERHELSDISLFWMVGEILELSLFALDTDFIKRSKQPNPDDWGTSQPHNAYDETPLPARLILHAENRLDSGDITKNILIHESWKYSPKQKALKDSYKMVAPDTLAKHFSPTYARLNEFEKECKDHWKQRLGASPIISDNVTRLFDSGLRWTPTEEVITSKEYGYVKDGKEVYDDASLIVERASFGGGIYQEKYPQEVPDFRLFSNEVEESTDECQLLVGKSKSLRWIRVHGDLEANKLEGHIPVIGGREPLHGLPLYISQGYYEKGVYCGNVKARGLASISYNHVETTLTVYNVLCKRRPQFSFNNSIGSCATDRDPAKVSTGVTFSKQIAFEQSASLPPRVVLGLNLLDISSQANYRVRSFVDNVTTADLVAHIDSWNNTAFVNGAISWLKLSASDPAFQCGDIAATGSPTPQRVPFNWQFDVQPTVLVALSGFDIGNDPQLSVSATNIDRTGFTLQVETGRNTSFNSCNVSWVAFPTGKRGISFGTFGGNSQTSTEYSGTLDFTPSAAFKRPPQVFTTLTKLDADPSRNLRVQITTSNVSENGMSWKVATWGDSILWNVQGAYLAIEPGLLE